MRYLSHVSDVDFDWPKIFVSHFTFPILSISFFCVQWNGMTTHDQDNFVNNVVGHLGAATSDTVKKRQAALFAKVNKSLGERIAKGINVTL